MRSTVVSVIAAVSSLLAVGAGVASASPAGQLPNLAQSVVDWTAQEVSALGDDGTVHAQNGWQFIDCGEPEDAIEIKTLRVVPDPPEAGKKMTIYADGTAKKRIDEGAFVDVVVKLGLIKLIQKRFSLCDELRNANATLQCPIEPGDHQIVQSVDLPAEIPKAKFTVNALGFTQPPDSEPMTCATIVIDFMQRH